MDKMLEPIIVAKTSKVYGEYKEEELQGFIPGDTNKFQTLLDNYITNYGILRRGEAEENVEYKQIISYIIVRHGNELYATKRLNEQGEERLHGKVSVGIGGHMNHVQAEDFETILVKNAERELSEELNIPEEYIDKILYVGFINNDKEEVGKHHIGLLGIVDVADTVGISVKETHKMEGKWMNLEELSKIGDTLEDWSKIAVDNLDRI